jgi:hypothetical protein
MTEHPLDRFEQVLKLHGWTIAPPPGGLAKGDWRIFADTSSWMILQTASNPRTFDVAVPDAYRIGWTVNLIEHLARIEDERARLRAALAAIRDDPGAGPSARAAANAALAECYHAWLVANSGEVCSICGAQGKKSAATFAAQSIATLRSQLWSVAADDVRQSLADRLDSAESELAEHPERAADELEAFVQELNASPHGAPEPAAEGMIALASHACGRLRAGS